MEEYSRAYRDPNSPLTPLTPLTTNVFNFNIDEQPSTSRLLLPSTRRSSSSRQRGGNSFGAENVNELCQIFGQGLCSTLVSLSTPRSCDSGLRKQRRNSVAAAAGNFPNYNSGRTCGGEFGGRCIKLPSKCNRRSIKYEQTSSQLPDISLEPPPTSNSQRQLITSIDPDRIKYEIDEQAIESLAAWEAGLTPTTSAFNPRSLTTNSFSRASEQQRQLQQQSQIRKQFDASNVRVSSPVPPQPMSPRFGAFLARWGINCLQSIFERQEIDMQTFCCLNADDLELLGIQDPENRERALQAINFLAGLLSKK